MSNTLSGLIPTLYQAVDVVSRELVGFIPAITLDAGLERAAVGQTVTSFVTQPQGAIDIVPGVTAPNDGDQTILPLNMTIQKAKYVPIRWGGEEEKKLAQGLTRERIQVDQFAQAMRTLANLVEADCWTAAYQAASRAYGTPGSTPFTSDVKASAFVRKILDDNGCPPGDRSLVFDTTAGANLRSLPNVTKANEAGGTEFLRQGTLLDMHGFAFRESAQVQTPTKGTGSAYTSNSAGYAVGSTAITLITGSGTILAGDVVTFAGDTNQYNVISFSGGVLTIGNPGLRVALPASAVAVTVLNTATKNVGFRRSAIVGALRPPAVPKEGDAAVDSTIIVDPISGIPFEVRMYMQYRQVRYEVALAWGINAVKQEHIALLLG